MSSASSASEDEKHLFLNGASDNYKANFQVSVSGKIRGGYIADRDQIKDQSASGVIWGSWQKDYYFTGDITSFKTDGKLHAFVVRNGQLPTKISEDTIEDPPGHHLFILPKGTKTEYELTVSGKLATGWSTEGTEKISGQTASGMVWSGKQDDYFYTGKITGLQLKGEAKVFIDGDRVDPDSLDDKNMTTPAPYVSVEGTQLVLDSHPFISTGVNSFWCSYVYYDRSAIDEVIRGVEAMGLNTLRLWGFGSGNPHLFQPSPGEYNETAFERLDYVIQQANKHDLKLVITLGNYWSDFGGIDQYVSWSESATSRDDFYRDETCQQLYRDYIEYVLTRQNSLTGRELRNESSILMWELLNEPRDEAAPAGDNDVLHNWAHETAQHIKALDSNHLVSTGAEGFVQGETTKYDNAGYWMNELGYDFVGLHDSEYIDVASVHLYPDHWGISNESAIEFLQDRARDASRELNKPLYLGEFGRAVTDDDDEDKDLQIATRNDHYIDWFQTADNTGFSGALVWQLTPDRYYSIGDPFSFRYPEDKSTVDTIRSGASTLSNQ